MRVLTRATMICFAFATGCQQTLEPGPTPLAPTPVRADRRAYHGAPPVIPHPPLAASCTTCHGTTARDLPGLGVAPANPHQKTPGLSAAARCQQCHVFQTSSTQLVANAFQGLSTQLRRGDRLYPTAPPVMPHPLFMREACASCHTGPGIRPEIRCSHPERLNCIQCHARPPSVALLK